MAILTPKLDSVHEMSPRALGELKAWLEPWFLNQNKCCAAAAATPDPYPDVIASLATAKDLRSYWRLGEVASPFADTGGYSGGPSDMQANAGSVGTTPIAADVTPGLISTDDDGAIRLEEEGDDVSHIGVVPFLELVSPGDVSNFDFGSGHPTMSVTAWVKPSAAGNTFWGGVVSFTRDVGAGASAFTGGWALQVSFPDGEVEFWRNASFGSHITATSAAATIGVTQAHFIAATYDGTTINVYANGALVASQADATTVPAIVGGATVITIGGHQYRQSSVLQDWQPFYGVIDEVSVWGGVLSAGDISNLYASGTVASILTSSLSYVTVQTGAPGSYLTPFVFDDTPATGGLYGWDGSSYQQVGGPI